VARILKETTNGMSSTWYDEYFEGECEDEKTNLVMDFT